MFGFLSHTVLLLGIFCLASCYKPATADRGEGSLMMPKELKGVDVIDMSGKNLPLDLKLTNQDGEKILLGDYFGDIKNNKKYLDKPVILTLGYYECPMLCSLVLNGLTESLNKVNLVAGKDYSILSVSIDPREKAELAKAKRDSYVGALKNKNSENNKIWNFHVAKKDQIEKLANAVGFKYNYIKKMDEYAHGAAVFVISPSGLISRTHYGVSYSPRDIKISMINASEGSVGSPLEKLLLSCLHYDPDSHTYGVYVFGVMRLGAVVTMLLMAFYLLLFFRREGKSKRFKNLENNLVG